ncbi:MAG: type 1 glutamine amidotransferase domain-containing protein [Cyclobacteriaceae bacterium]|nr:type 1 glutamine amidotransferase domain-containing protein [Cyclobacteriaceae bacterium]
MNKTILFILFIVLSFSGVSQSKQKKILIVSTNVDTVGTNVSGTYAMEIAHPWKTFTDKGFDVDVVTPKGGKAAIYNAAKTDDDIVQIQNNEAFIKTTTNTLSPTQVNPKDYVAIFYPGGHGQYFDVISDERIAVIAAAIYENGGYLGTAGHGAASILDIRLKNGKFLIEGKRMTVFPLWAEKEWMNISNFGKLLQFDMQEVALRRGANLIVCTKATIDDNTLTRVIDTKNRMVTGSFARSAKWVSEEDGEDDGYLNKVVSAFIDMS